MSYLGNSPEKDIVINKKEYIATEGQTSFGVIYDDYVEVYLNGVRLADSDYTALTGANIVLSIPATAGDIIQCSGFQSVTFMDAVQVDGANGAAQIPYGTTAQRPTSPDNGYLRYNTDLLMMESYSNGEWGGVGGDPDFPMVNNLVPTGETVSIPAGRTLVHPNLQVNGTLEIDGTLFIPSGGSVSTTEVDATVVKQNGNVVANDSEVVHKTGNETIAGVKTFSSSPIVPNATTATQPIAYGQAVKNTGYETIAGVKTFSSSPIVPTPTTGTQAANKDYIDNTAIGVGQTWQDMTSSRTVATTYTNTTGRTIHVLISANCGTSTTFVVSGVNIYVQDTSSAISIISAPIPSGETYRLGGYANSDSFKWLELI